VVILISAMRQGPTPLRPRRLTLRSDQRHGNRAASPSRSLFLIECQGTERSLNAPRRAAHDAGLEMSGSAVSAPRADTPTKGQPIVARISVAPSQGFCRDIHELPSEATPGVSQKLRRCRTDARNNSVENGVGRDGYRPGSNPGAPTSGTSALRRSSAENCF
jgi:hypothetical protein